MGSKASAPEHGTANQMGCTLAQMDIEVDQFRNLEHEIQNNTI